MQRRIAVLMGGVSAEREVSLRSGNAVADALRHKAYDVVEIDIAEEDISAVQALDTDVAFVALHGRFGEDGAVQGLLEEAGIPYTGSDARASRAGMDKMASKCFFITHDVPTPPFRLVTTTQRWDQIDEAVTEARLPLAVKPLRQGSSIGISIAKTREDVAVALARAFRYGHQALLERYIPGREFTVGILDRAALPVIELRTSRPFFSYEAKYDDPSTEYVTSPDLPSDVYDKLQSIALSAHESIGCRHFSRVDMMIEDDGCIYALEVNTIPGFTERSLFPLAAREAGMPFPDLCERMVEMAMAPAVAHHAGVSGPAT